MTEPKLLTEAEWRERINASEHFTELAIAALKKDGLVAGDPDLLEAWKVVGAWALETFGAESSAVAHYLTNKVVEDMNTHLALAGLKRGKELAQPKPLTREMVAAAWEHYAVNGPYGVDGLHTALMEQMK